MKLKSIFVSMFALAALASCSNDDVVDSGTTSSQEAKSLKIQFQTAPSTRAIETPGIPTGAQANIKSATIYFFKEDGSSAMYNGSRELKLTSAAIADAMDLSKGYVIEQVDGDVKSVTIRANDGEFIVGKNINEFQKAEQPANPGATPPTEATNFHKFHELEGSAVIKPSNNLNTDGHKLYTAEITLAPALARIEVQGGFDVKPVYSLGTEQLKDDKGSFLYEHRKIVDGETIYYNSTVSSLVDGDDTTYPVVAAKAQIQTGYYAMEVVAIHMNNIILKKGQTTHQWLQEGTTPAWNTAFATGGTHENMFDKLTLTGTPATAEKFGSKTTAGTGNWWNEQTAPASRNIRIVSGKAAAYQLFDQHSTADADNKSALAKDLPHIIVEVKIQDQAGDTLRTAYVNIRTFIDADATETIKPRITAFENGKIYKIDLNDLSGAFDDVKFENGNKIVPGPDTPNPDPDTAFDLNVMVKITDWAVKNLTPEI